MAMPPKFTTFIKFSLRFSEIYSYKQVKPNKDKMIGVRVQWTNLNHYGIILDLKLNDCIFLAFLWFFLLFTRDLSKSKIFIFFYWLKNATFFIYCPNYAKYFSISTLYYVMKSLLAQIINLYYWHQMVWKQFWQIKTTGWKNNWLWQSLKV